MDWLRQIAPTIATAMGGPLAGMAVSVISKAIGVDPDKVGDMISNNKLTAEQIAQVKIAEIELQKQAQELGLNFEKLEVEDRKSARDMQAATRSMMPPILAGSVTVGFFGIMGMMFHGAVDSSNPAILMMLGSLGTAWTGIISYYFGSSAGSQAKTDLLSKKA
jgi:ABC-type iron transport system FetAB permease component